MPSTNMKWMPMPRVGRNRRRRIAFAVAELLAMKDSIRQNSVIVRVADSVVDGDSKAEVVRDHRLRS